MKLNLNTRSQANESLRANGRQGIAYGHGATNSKPTIGHFGITHKHASVMGWSDDVARIDCLDGDMDAEAHTYSRAMMERLVAR